MSHSHSSEIGSFNTPDDLFELTFQTDEGNRLWHMFEQRASNSRERQFTAAALNSARFMGKKCAEGMAHEDVSALIRDTKKYYLAEQDINTAEAILAACGTVLPCITDDKSKPEIVNIKNAA